MNEIQNNTQRIAKNTIVLYIRQIFILVISLYTVRITLNILGATDYGIYNVVGGVVVLFSFINSAMASSTQRFLNFYLGKKDSINTNRAYSSSIIIHFGISILFILLAETLGLWYVHNKLNIPSDRKLVAEIVYQISVFTAILNIMKIPYNAVIIAYEKMSFFAWVSIFESVAKLSLIIVIKYLEYDRLIEYAFFMAFIAFVILITYKVFCNIKFKIARFKFHKNYELTKELIVFSGWSLFGGVANVCNTQGVNLVLNMFTNVVVNAAMGIANQVNNAIYSFVTNFQTAFNPQLIKSYSGGDNDYFFLLLKRSAKFSFLLYYFIFLPFFVNADRVLLFWLKDVPEYSSSFVKLILIWSLIDVFNNPLYTAIQATGKIRTYNIMVSVFKLLPLPLIIVLFMNGFSPNWIFYSEIIFSIVIDIWRLVYASKKLNFGCISFFKDIVCRCIFIIILSLPLTLLINKCTNGMQELTRFLLVCVFSVILNMILYITVGLNKDEIISIREYIKKHFKRG